MSKVLKIVGTVVAVVGIVASAVATFGASLGISAAVVGAAGTVASIAGIAALAVGLVGMAIGPPKPTFSRHGNPLQFQTNPQSGLPYPIGRTRMSGVRIHGETYDAPAFKSEGKDDVLAFGVLLGAGGPMQEIEVFRADKQAVAFDGAGNASGTFVGYMAQVTSLGLAGASALALTFGGVSFPGWTSEHKLSGIAHALWDLRFDEKGERFGAGVPEPEWIGKWVKVYDPRKDSTYPGGSGSHRALNESTYEWSRNPALHALTWALGRWQNGKRTLGIGAPVANIRIADFVEAANVADANGWHCGGVEWSTDSKWSILKKMLQAGGAEPTMTGAMIGCRVNTPRVSIATIEARHLLDALSLSTTKSRRDRFNTVIPRYRSEAHEWEVISGSAVQVYQYVVDDGGVRTKEIDFPLVQHEIGQAGVDGNAQAGQLAAYEIVNSREAGPIRFTVGPQFIGIKTGDVITLDVPEEGLDAQPVLIRSRSIDPATLKITFEAETETSAKHAYALGQSTTPPPAYSLTPPDLTPPMPSADLWSLTAGHSGEGLPAIIISGACEFPGADSVLLEFRRAGDTNWLTLGKAEASSTVNHVVSPLGSQTQYEARVAYQSGNRVGPWRHLGTVTTGVGIITLINETLVVDPVHFTFQLKGDGTAADPERSVTFTAVSTGLDEATFTWGLRRVMENGDRPELDATLYLSHTTGPTTSITEGDFADALANGMMLSLFVAAPGTSEDYEAAAVLLPLLPQGPFLVDPKVHQMWLPSSSDGKNVAGTFASANVQVTTAFAGSDVTDQTTFAIIDDSGNVTATINTADNVPVSGKPRGWFQITDLAAQQAGRVELSATYNDHVDNFTIIAHRDRAPVVSGNEWQDPQFATRDTAYAGGAFAFPFAWQNDASYKYPLSVQLRTTTTPTSEFFHKVQEVPVRYAGEKFWAGFAGGLLTGATGPVQVGIYLRFLDKNRTVIGTAQKVTGGTIFNPTGDWPAVDGGPIEAPANAAWLEYGYYRNAHGVTGSGFGAIAFPYLQRTQPGANNTEQHAPSIRGASERQAVTLRFDGTILYWPTALQFYRYQGNVDVSANTTWSLGDVTLAASSVSISSTGLLTITGLTKLGSVTVRGAHNNVTSAKKISFVGQLEHQPREGINQTEGPPLAATLTSTTPVVISDVMSIVAQHASLTFGCQLGAAPVSAGITGNGEFGAYVQMNVGGTWTTAGVFWTTGTVPYRTDEQIVQYTGGGTVTIGSGGAFGTITPGNTYQIRFVARLEPLNGGAAQGGNMRIFGGRLMVRSGS